MPHLIKTPAGAALRFERQGYPSSLLQAFLNALRSDLDLPPAQRAKAETLLGDALAWPLDPSQRRSLMLPCGADQRSGKEHAVDGHAIAADVARALTFHEGRPWLNALAKSRGWRQGALLLELDARLSRPLSLAKGMLIEDAADESLYGGQRGFALFIGPGYVEAKGSQILEDAPISRAKIFESATDARQFASRKKILKRVSVVEISIRATRVAQFAENGFDQQRLLAAIARAEKAEFEALLREREANELREKVARLEAAQAPAEATPSRGRL